MRSITLLTAASLLALSACGSEETALQSSEPLPTIAAPEGSAWVDTVSKTEENGYVIGNPEAPIKLVEYAALTCGACASFEHEAYDEIFDKYVTDGRVSFEIRNFLLNPYGIPLGILTRCGPPESYKALTEQVFKNQAAILDGLRDIDQNAIQVAFSKAETEGYGEVAKIMGIIDFFKTRGISEDQANACLADPKNAQELLDMTEKGGKEYKVEGTPTFFLNNQKVEYSGWANLKGKLQEAGAR